MLTEEVKANIARVLDERFSKFGGTTKCPMCGNPHLALSEAYFNQTLQTDLGVMNLGGPSIPTIGVICTNCGFVSHHAIGVLGLLPKEEAQDGKK
ncbi:MAG: hypothetical protein ABIK82_16425 [Pseudomonadota bacterium]